MNEVACRVFEAFKGPLAAKGLSLADMVKGTTVSTAKLRSRTERIDWAEFVAIMKTIRTHFTDEEYVAIGRALLHTPAVRFAVIIARLAFTPMAFYRWLHKPISGLGNQLFTCVKSSYREVSANELIIELTMPDTLEMCWDFFVIASGTNATVPELFGLPPAKVVLSAIPRGGRLEITLPKTRIPIHKRIQRALTFPYTAWVAAHELKEAHEMLVDVQSRMAEFAARLRQAEQLSTLAMLTAGLAQDIRDPANGIVNAIEPLVEQLPRELLDPKTGPGQLLGILSGCAEQVSALSRLIGTTGNPHVDTSPEYVTEVVDRAIHLARGALDQVDVHVSRSLIVRVQCSKPLLAQALMSLIENAGHAAGPGGWVDIAMKTTATLVQIEVSDSGGGGSAATVDRAFDPFSPTKAPNDAGLGLCVARAIVQLHRGVLERRECDGRPAFVMELPVVTPPAVFGATLHARSVH